MRKVRKMLRKKDQQLALSFDAGDEKTPDGSIYNADIQPIEHTDDFKWYDDIIETGLADLHEKIEKEHRKKESQILYGR